MLSANARITAFYFAASMSTGAINGFGGLWLQSRGVSADQIGLIFALPIAGAFLLNMYVGRLADRSHDWRTVIVIGALISAVVPFALLNAESVFVVGLVWTMAITARIVVQPISDAASIRRSRRVGGDFARLYAWKTVGYLGLVLATGLVVDRSGIEGFLWMLLVSSAVYGFVALTLPRFRGAQPEQLRPRNPLWIANADRAILLPLVSWSLVHCTHSVLNAFIGVIWIEQGVTAFWVGTLIAFSGIVETGVFSAFKRFLDNYRPTTLILVSCLVGVVRWVGLATEPPLEVLFVLQVLQGFTYALGFIACTNLIADLSTEDAAAEAQSVFQLIQMATSFAVVLLFGYLVDLFAAGAFYVSAALAALGATLVWRSSIERSTQP